jgi:hypothetical protein
VEIIEAYMYELQRFESDTQIQYFQICQIGRVSNVREYPDFKKKLLTEFLLSYKKISSTGDFFMKLERAHSRKLRL